MNKEPSQSAEVVGLHKIAGLFRSVGSRCLHVANRINFVLYRMDFGQREDDIYLVTFPKSGTTMTQIILYQLCTNGAGDMDFQHIYDVSPWIANDAMKRRPVPDVPSPRIIKSHDAYRAYEKGTKGRFIYVLRDGMDVAVSLFHQNKNYNNPNLTFDESFERFVKKNRNNWFHHVRDWKRNRHHFPILYLRYEDLVENKREEISKIIRFLNLKVGETAIENALRYSSFDYMKAHEEKFGVQPPDLSHKVFDQFIRSGKTGEGEDVLSEKQKLEFREAQTRYLGNILQTKN